MFVIQGQSGSLSAIVATASAQKAIFHFRRMTRSGLHPIIKREDGQICHPRAIGLERPALASLFAAA